MNEPPLVSIALPVYNGARFLRATLECLLAQEYEHFELIIRDNASTDATGEIAREFAARDRRIRYERAGETAPATENFSLAFAMARGKYFMWASDHDIWKPALLPRCVEIMEADPDVVLCFPIGAEIDEQGQSLGRLRGGFGTRGLKPARRYWKTIRGITGYAVYGVHRTGALRRVLPVKRAIGPDSLLLNELAFLGTFAFVPEEMFYLRRMSHSLNWGRYFGNLHMELNPWALAGAFGGVIGNYLDIVRRHVRSSAARELLGLRTVYSVCLRTLVWFGGMAVSLLSRRFYRPW